MIDTRSLRLLAPLSRREFLRPYQRRQGGARLLSTAAPKCSALRHLYHRPRQSCPQPIQSQQFRNFSLFGWGASKDAELSEVHSPNSDGSTLGIPNAEPVSPSATAPIKAIHSTSDTAASTTPHTPEPQILHDLENAIASPRGVVVGDISAQNDLSTVPEGIGYLKNLCGLDYGWGPTSLLQWTLEHLHISAGLSWTASILAVAVIVRIIAFRFSLRASDAIIRMREVTPVLKPLQEEYKAATLANDSVRKSQAAHRINTIQKDFNVRIWQPFVPILIQAPLSFGAFRLLRGMSALPVPGLEKENWLWAMDLTQSDPYLLLPTISAVCLWLNAKLGSETGSSPAQGQLAHILRTAIPGVSFIFLLFQPSAVQLFFSAGGFLSLLQSYTIRNATFRSAMGLLPMKTPSPPTAEFSSVGGLRTSGPRPGEPSSKSNVSRVDQFVDGVKKSASKMSGGLKSWGDSYRKMRDENVASKKKKASMQRAEEYELTRRLQLEHERQLRKSNEKFRDTEELRQANYDRDAGNNMDEDDVERPPPTRAKGKLKKTKC